MSGGAFRLVRALGVEASVYLHPQPTRRCDLSLRSHEGTSFEDFALKGVHLTDCKTSFNFCMEGSRNSDL